MSHSTPATYLVWSLLSVLVGLILLPFVELTDVLFPCLIVGDIFDLSSLVL